MCHCTKGNNIFNYVLLTGNAQRADSRKKQTRFIQVKNLPSSIDTDFLELFFESRKKQGGGPVKNVAFEKDGGALVEFEESRCKCL